VQAVLIYLAANPGMHSRSELVGLLWPDQPDSRARRNHRYALWDLRRRLSPELLVGERLQIGLNPGITCHVDAVIFGDYIARARKAIRQGNERDAILSLRSAVDIYRGDFLSGFDLPGVLQFQEWALRQRARLQQEMLQACSDLASYHMRRREYQQAILYTRRQLELEPWWEEGHRRLMRLLALSGQRSAALAQYEVCQRVLAENLGVEPATETKTLRDQIRVSLSSPSNNLPLQPTPFLGRKEELEALAERLTDPTCRLLTILGPGGVGKTRLAIQAASEAEALFLNGVHFVPLSSVTSAESMLPAIARALGLHFHRMRSPWSQIIDYCREKEMLLLLDGFEHLLGPNPGKGKTKEKSAVDLVVEILQQAPRVKVLVTSRQRLNLRWEWVFDLKGLPYPTSEAGDPEAALQNSQWSSIRLFLQSARRTCWRFDPRNEAEWVVRICQVVEGMPLGIELAAAWVGTRSCASIARGIKENLDFLSCSMKDVPLRQRSLRATFDYSWNLLSATEQRVLQRLSVFQGGFDREAALRVTGASQSLLSSLVNKSMLQRQESGRYRMHEVIRRYAEEKLRSANEEKEVRQRHMRYFVVMAERAKQALNKRDQDAQMDQLEREYGNLRRALEWALNGEESAGVGLRLASALWRFWEVRGYLTEGSSWLQKAIDRAGASPASLHARAHAFLGLGRLQWCQGKYELSRKSFEESEALFQGLEDKRGVSRSLSNLGLVAWRQSEYEKALSFYERSLALGREAGDKPGVAVTLANMALLAWFRGEFQKAERLYSESLSLFHELGDKQNIALSLNNLGALVQEMGDYERSRDLLTESLALFRKLGAKQGIAWALGNLANTAWNTGDYRKAQELWEESLALAQELGDRYAAAVSLINLCKAASERREVDLAEELCKRGLALHKKMGNKRDIPECLENLAIVAHQQGREERAARLFGAAEALRKAFDVLMPSGSARRYERYVNAVRAGLDERVFDQVWREGRMTPLDQAVAYALES
jgi:predicted ATPase/DNA-binding SARP family transcriptional activator